MRIILTSKDLKKPLTINGQKEENGDRERLTQDILKNPEIVSEIIITKKQINIITRN